MGTFGYPIYADTSCPLVQQCAQHIHSKCLYQDICVVIVVYIVLLTHYLDYKYNNYKLVLHSVLKPNAGMHTQNYS